ncbi:MAG: tRNA (N6-isopentenyl adenosine(37)-C2)-methylthiotransferase MiaB [Nitrospinota bacterium]|nr:MAG: tRNA (N6-isopentenyl adenosine(37)-C2)-methylthiotransferase MiaB [Nitrospinota bacterium]
MGTQKKLAVLTYGCQMNKYSSERMAGMFQAQGYDMAERVQEADVILLNTCSVREKAEQKVYSQLGRLKGLKRKNPALIIGVAGCVAQQEGERLIQRMPFVDMVFSPQNVVKLPQLVQEVEEKRTRVMALGDNDAWYYHPYPVRRESRVQAWVGVMEGCDKFCSFCIVPYTRGRERSKPLSLVVQEVTQLAQAGYKEVTLLGQNITSYGKRSPEGGNLVQLLRAVHQVEGIVRLRFLTSHPREFSEELMATIAELPKVCEGIHLPVQSGSNAVLRRMRRGYTVEEYLRKVETLRRYLPEVGLSTDIIVGFPGERAADFAQTRALLEEVGYDSVYLFRYSPRPGTRAASLPDQVPEEVKSERFAELSALIEQMGLQKNRGYEGRCVEVLVEGPSKKKAHQLTGRTRNNKIVNFSGEDRLIGELVSVTITRGGPHSLEGELIES